MIDKIIKWFNTHKWLGLGVLLGVWFLPVDEEYLNDKPTGKRFNIFGFPLPASFGSAIADTGNSSKRAEAETITDFAISDAHDDYFYWRSLGNSAESAENYVITKYGASFKQYIVGFETAYSAKESAKKSTSSMADNLVNAFEKSKDNQALKDFYTRANSVEK